MCREREAFGRLYDNPLMTGEWYWYCAPCLDALFERLRALALHPSATLPPMSTPTARVDIGTAHRPLPPVTPDRRAQREALAKLRDDFAHGVDFTRRQV